MILSGRGAETLGPSIAILFSCIFPQVFLEPSLPRQVPAWRLLQQQSKTMLSRCPLLNSRSRVVPWPSCAHSHWRPLLSCPPGPLQALVPARPLDWHCQHRMAVPGSRESQAPCARSLGTLSAPAGISDDAGDFTTAWREAGQFLWANHKASVKHQLPCPKWLHQPCPKATSFASHCLQPVPGQLRQRSRSHLCAKDSAQPSSAPVGRAGTRAEPSSFAAV